jgi:hypothetical protein
MQWQVLSETTMGSVTNRNVTMVLIGSVTSRNVTMVLIRSVTSRNVTMVLIGLLCLGTYFYFSGP